MDPIRNKQIGIHISYYQTDSTTCVFPPVMMLAPISSNSKPPVHISITLATTVMVISSKNGANLYLFSLRSMATTNIKIKIISRMICRNNTDMDITPQHELHECLFKTQKNKINLNIIMTTIIIIPRIER